MKKIMFNDKFGLTEAVLSGRKTQTRRICKEQVWAFSDIVNAENGIFHFEIPRYKVGEVVAIAQSYGEVIDYGNRIGKIYICPKNAGWDNKMFVRADLMPHHICITDIKIERLQDISDDDCIREGIYKGECGSADTHFMDAYYYKGDIQPYITPRRAYENLIDCIFGKETWMSNPYVFVFDFELVK